VTIVFLIGLQLGLVWVSVAVAETCLPAASRLLGREGAARYGAAAVVGAATVISFFVFAAVLLRNLPSWFPTASPVDNLSIPETVAIPLPAIAILWQAIVAALALSAAVAGIVAALDATPANRRLLLQIIIGLSLMLIATDASIRLEQVPLMLLVAMALVALLYLSARYVLRNNYLAYPLTFFAFSLLSSASSLMQNDRLDLQINAAVLLLIALATLAFYALGSRAKARTLSPSS